VRRCETGSCGLEQDSVAGLCEHCNKPYGSIEGRTFIDHFSKMTAPWS
jgi:hypothetical protein